MVIIVLSYILFIEQMLYLSNDSIQLFLVLSTSKICYRALDIIKYKDIEKNLLFLGGRN